MPGEDVIEKALEAAERTAKEADEERGKSAMRV